MTFHSEPLAPARFASRSGFFSRLLAAARRSAGNRAGRRQARRDYQALMDMSDAHLRDIGLTRADVYAFMYGRPD